MNRQARVTWRNFCTIAHSLMVHTKFSEAYIHFSFMYTTDHIFPVLPIKDLIKEDSETTPTFTHLTGTKPSVSNLCMLFCSCVV